MMTEQRTLERGMVESGMTAFGELQKLYTWPRYQETLGLQMQQLSREHGARAGQFLNQINADETTKFAQGVFTNEFIPRIENLQARTLVAQDRIDQITATDKLPQHEIKAANLPPGFKDRYQSLRKLVETQNPNAVNTFNNLTKNLVDAVALAQTSIPPEAVGNLYSIATRALLIATSKKEQHGYGIPAAKLDTQKLVYFMLQELSSPKTIIARDANSLYYQMENAMKIHFARLPGRVILDHAIKISAQLAQANANNEKLQRDQKTTAEELNQAKQNIERLQSELEAARRAVVATDAARIEDEVPLADTTSKPRKDKPRL